MSAYVRFSPEFVKQKPSWYFYSAVVYVPPVSIILYGGHSFWLDKYKSLVSYCQYGKPVEVPKDLKATFEKVKEDLPTHNFYKKFLSVFMVNGFNPFYAGTTKQLHGAIVGIPKYFTYKSIDDVKNDSKGIRIQETPVQWDYVDPEVKNTFFDSLVLSEKAIKYVMAYNCVLADSFAVHLYPLYPILFGFLNCIMGDYLTMKLKLRKKPIIFTLGVAILVLSGSFCSWISLVNLHKNLTEKGGNNAIKEMGEEYVEGGIEYWNKLTARNIALRHLMKGGESRFSTQGKENFLLGSGGIAPIDQKMYYTELLKELREEKETQEDEAGVTES